MEALVHASAHYFDLDALVALVEFFLHSGRQLAIRNAEAVVLFSANVLMKETCVSVDRLGKFSVGGFITLVDALTRCFYPGNQLSPTHVVGEEHDYGVLGGSPG